MQLFYYINLKITIILPSLSVNYLKSTNFGHISILHGYTERIFQFSSPNRPVSFNKKTKKKATHGCRSEYVKVTFLNILNFSSNSQVHVCNFTKQDTRYYHLNKIYEVTMYNRILRSNRKIFAKIRIHFVPRVFSGRKTTLVDKFQLGPMEKCWVKILRKSSSKISFMESRYGDIAMYDMQMDMINLFNYGKRLEQESSWMHKLIG